MDVLEKKVSLSHNPLPIRVSLHNGAFIISGILMCSPNLATLFSAKKGARVLVYASGFPSGAKINRNVAWTRRRWSMNESNSRKLEKGTQFYLSRAVHKFSNGFDPSAQCRLAPPPRLRIGMLYRASSKVHKTLLARGACVLPASLSARCL